MSNLNNTGIITHPQKGLYPEESIHKYNCWEATSFGIKITQWNALLL